MGVDFETKCEQHALEYIKIHLREGYFVNAYVDKGTYYWEKVYKIHTYKKSDAVCESKWQTEYERASEQREHDILYEPTYNKDDGSM